MLNIKCFTKYFYLRVRNQLTLSYIIKKKVISSLTIVNKNSIFLFEKTITDLKLKNFVSLKLTNVVMVLICIIILCLNLIIIN